MIEIDPAAVAHLMKQLTPQAANHPANLPADDSSPGEMRVVWCDLSDPKQKAEFADQLCAARALLRWSQDDLARHAGVKLRTVQRLENEHGTPAESTVSGVCAALAAAGIQLMADGKGGIGVWRLRR